MSNFSHFDETGRPVMVNVGEKKVTNRFARARSIVVLPAEVLDKMVDRDIRTSKGAVFQTAIIAGIMAAKKT
ncbi:MAG TPA: cyclic pyranopterin monophosphate synthase MoaC, partial [Chitinophagaceae bacterium]|nr:cyclic pyranopterin monophosphate synthase MoaC [Chitinophagaceae bacterium]